MIENMIVIGAGEKFVGALIVPDFNQLNMWCKENNVDCSDNQKTVNNPLVQDLYKMEVEKYNQSFNHVEQIKKFEIIPYEWSIDSGEMTPKLSLKRKVIMEKNKDAIKRIYG
jgi:long-chain acyl-CoA synthetase